MTGRYRRLGGYQQLGFVLSDGVWNLLYGTQAADSTDFMSKSLSWGSIRSCVFSPKVDVVYVCFGTVSLPLDIR